MAQRGKSRTGSLLHQWQAALLLLVFLSARGLVPAGFMPASIAGGSPYDLCHGDSRSALLLQWLAGQEHHHHGNGHQHDALTAQSFADNHCSFAASASIAAAPALELQFAVADSAQPLPPAANQTLRQRSYLLPPPRAPPFFPST